MTHQPSRRTKRYPTDLTDAQWAELDVLLPDPACLAGRAYQVSGWGVVARFSGERFDEILAGRLGGQGLVVSCGLAIARQFTHPFLSTLRQRPG